MIQSKKSALLSLILVFVSGAFCGGFAYRLYSVPSVQTTPGGPPPRPRPEDVKRNIVDDLTKTVHLDDEQVKRLNGIMDRTHQEFDQLREKSKPEWDDLNQRREALMEKWRPEQDAIRSRQTDQINAMLREDQKPLYAAWRAERDRQRKLREQHKKQ